MSVNVSRSLFLQPQQGGTEVNVEPLLHTHRTAAILLMQNPAEGDLSKSSSSFCRCHRMTSAACLFYWSGSASVASHHPPSTHTSPIFFFFFSLPSLLLLFPVRLLAPPSPSTHMTFRWPIRSIRGWMYGRSVTTKHKLQSHSPPPLSILLFSHLLSLSLSSPSLLSTPPSSGFHSHYLLIPSFLSLLSPPSFPLCYCSCHPSRHPSLS